MQEYEIALHNTIFLAVSGSKSYGTDTPESDEDLRGAFLGLPINRMGLYRVNEVKFGADGSAHVVEEGQENAGHQDKNDHVRYELATLFKHFLTGAPNMLELLFLRPEDVRVHTPPWERVRENRNLFVTQQMGHKAIGFVSGMIKRSMHNKSKNSPDWLKQMHKQSSHGIRIGKMVSEALLTGELRVYRDEDGDYLRRLKQGKEDVEAAWEECERLIALLKTNLEISPLPHHADKAQANALLVDITFDYWRALGVL